MSYVGEALDRLAGQFHASPKLRALLTAIVGPLDDAQGTADALKTERWIDTAIGKQLDGCGAIVGELRQGRDDDAYRKAIRFRVFVNVSNGTPNDLLTGLRYLVDSDDYQYLEMYPATAIMFADGPDVPIDIQTLIQDLAPAGVAAVPVCVSYAWQEPFRFSRELPPGELFVNGGADYLTANGSDLQISGFTSASTGSRLGGLAPSEIDVNGLQLDIAGSIFVIHSSNHDIPLESGSHPTGVFQ